MNVKMPKSGRTKLDGSTVHDYKSAHACEHFYPARVRSRGKVIMLGRGIYVNLKRPLQADSPHHYPMEGSSCSLQATPPAH